MMKLVIATAMLMALSAQAHTSQPCGGRAAGKLTDRTENYRHLLPDSSRPANTKATVKGKGIR